MNWPWVSRARLLDVQGQVRSLEVRVRELEEERKVLLDRILYGYGGAPVYHANAPPVYEPEPEPEPDLATAQVPTPAERTIQQVGPRARHVIRRMQLETDRALEAKREKVRKMIEQAAQEGVEAAIAAHEAQ